VMSCSEIMRFHAQLKPVQNFTFLKDPCPSTSSNFREQSVGVSMQISRIVADPRPQSDASAVRTSVIVTHCLLHDQVSWIPEPSPVARLRPVIYSAEWWLIADTADGLGQSHGRLCNRYYTDVHGRLEHTGPPHVTSVVTFSQARCVSCDAARADGWAFSLHAVNRMFSFAAFFTARATLCVIRYDHLAMKLGPDVQEWKFNHRLWTSITDARICKWCSVNQTSFDIPTVYSHFSLIFLRFLAGSVRCGVFIQCGGDSATDLRAVRYWARANWIRPEPDSVLRSVRSLISGPQVRPTSTTI